MTKDIGAAAIGLAVESIQNAIVIEQENQNLKEQLSSNMKIMDDLDIVIPRAKALQQQLKEKKELVEQKRQELVDLQKSVISALTRKPEPALPTETSLEAIPIVMNRIQRFITDLTDSAVDNKTIAVSILSLVKVNEALDRLYDAAVDSQVINETKEERDARIRNNTSTNKDIIEKVRVNITKQQQLQIQQQEELKQRQLQKEQQQQEQQEQQKNNEEDQSQQKEQSLKRDVLLPSLKDAAEKIEEEEEDTEKPAKSVSFPAQPPTITPSPVASAIAHRPPTPEPNFQKDENGEIIPIPPTTDEAKESENKE